MARHEIWKSHVDPESYPEILMDTEITDMDSEEAYDAVNEYTCNLLEDEMSNLDQKIPYGLFAVGNLGLWDGARVAVKELGYNLNDLFDLCDGYESSFYVEDGNTIAEIIHHDGVNRVTIREWNDRNRIEELYEILHDNPNAVESYIETHSTDVAARIAKVYGWDLN